jgi:glycosyltransferase involved in cell wall biosynthesis
MHRFSARIIAISEFLRNELIARGVPERKIHTIQHGIHPNTINVTEEEIEAVRRALKLDAHKKIVGIVGRLTRVKNHELFIRAGEKAALKHPDLVLLIVGDGQLRNDLEAQVRGLSMSEMTIFTGWVTKIYPIMCLLDVLVVSSWSEGFGFVLLEGMACGKAVVATHVSEIPQIVEDGKTGILVPPNNVQALADAIDYLLRHPEKRKEMGELARREVTRRFPLEREVESTTEIYLSTSGSTFVGKLTNEITRGKM